MSMKYKFLIIALISLQGFITSGWKKPPVVKVYAYAQPVASGIRQQTVSTDGGNEKLVTAPRQGMNYFIFIEYKRSKGIRPVYIWMDDKLYTVQVEEVSTPYYISTAEKIPNKQNQLVPKTKNKVLRLSFSGEAKGVNWTGDKNKEGIVIMYTCRKKSHYVTLDKITMLEPAAMM